MTDPGEKSNGDDAIAALVRLAGRRPPVPEDATRRIRAAVHAEWIEATRRRSQYRWAATAAAAATLAGAFLLNRQPSASTVAARLPVAVSVATVQTISGGVIGGRDTARRLLDSGSSVFPGESIETAGNSAASLTWGTATLRLDGGTHIRIASARRLELETGAVYIASDRRAAGGVTVKTALGEVRDVGTQFEVRVAADHLRVRVREGRINLERGSVSHAAAAGVELDADQGGAVTRQTIPRTGRDWDWVVRAAPPIALDGRTLNEVVSSAAREQGLTAVWSDSGARIAASKVLHGSVPLAPDEALDSALVASGLTSHVDGDRLVIERRK